MVSKASICSMALAHIGNTKGVSNFDTDTTTEANMCRLFFDQVVGEILETCAFPFSRRRAVLGLVEADPNDDWDYSYRYPSDARRVLAVANESAFINRNLMTNPNIVTSIDEQIFWKLPDFEIGGDDAGKLIFTNISDAQVYYIKEIPNPEKWPIQFVNAVAWGIAANVAMPLSRDPNIASRAQAGYQAMLSQVNASQLNESPTEKTEDSDIVKAYL